MDGTATIVLSLLAILCFTLGSVSSACVLNVYSESRPEFNGYMGGVNHFSEHVARTLKDCDRKCAMSTPCKGYTFDHETQACHLLNFTLSNTVGLTARPSAVYFARIQVVPDSFKCPLVNGQWYSAPFTDGCINIRVVHTYSNHDQAVADCNSAGGRLFLLNNAAKRTLYMTLYSCPGFSNSYLVDGRNDNAADYFATDAFRTSYGEVVPMMTPLWSWNSAGLTWRFYNPDIEHCLYMHGSHLHTWSCTSTMYFLCEKNY